MHSMSVESRATTIDDSMPLFVYLTASIHNERVDQPVSNIPVCLCKSLSLRPDSLSHTEVQYCRATRYLCSYLHIIIVLVCV